MNSIKKQFFSSLALLSLSFSALASLPGDHAALECPAGSFVSQKLNNESKAYFNSKFLLGFELNFNINYSGENNAAEIFSSIFTPAPTKIDPTNPIIPKLNVTLAEEPKVAVYYESILDPFTNQYDNTSYISCRYQIIKADPAYASSSSHAALVQQGLTSLTDGYLNIETNIKNAKCDLGNNKNYIFCEEVR